MVKSHYGDMHIICHDRALLGGGLPAVQHINIAPIHLQLFAQSDLIYT